MARNNHEVPRRKVTDMKSGLTSQELRFETASRLLETHKHHRMLDWPLWNWFNSDHLYTPSRWLDQTLRETLQMTFAEIAGARGIGTKKLEKLLTAIDRARNAIERGVPVELGTISIATGDNVREGTEFPYRVARDAYFLGSQKTPIWDLDDRDWDFVTQLVQHHGLEDFMLGRFTSSLRELDRCLWPEKVSTFTRRTFTQLGRMPGYGDTKIRQSVSQILRVAFILHALPESYHEMRIALLPATITHANRWLTQVCYSQGERLPDVHAIRKDFLQPLLTQLEKDTNARLVEVARRRIGIGGRQATLSEIGNDFGVTSDRIRTLIQQAAFVFHIRWPEGRYLLQGVCAELSNCGDAIDQRQLFERIHQVFFEAHKKSRQK